MFSIRVVRASALVLALAAFPAAAHAESLKEALTAAYKYNPNISSALTSVKIAAESIALRQAGLRPTIGAALSASDSFAATGGHVAVSDPTLQLGLSYSQTLFDNGKTDATISQAQALTEVATQGLRNEEQNVLLSVVNAYMSVIRDTQLVQLRSDNVKFYQTQVTSAQDRLRLGEGTKIDVSQAQASLASGVASYKAAIASLQTSQASFARWVGHKARNLSGSYDYGSLIAPSIEAATAQADARHPAILSAKAAIRAAQSGVDAAESAFGPSLALVGNLCGLGCFGGGIPGTGGISGSVKLTLTIPIYAGGALGASVRQANLSQIKSDLDAQATRDQVHEALITAWATLQNATAQITSAQSALDANNLALQGVIQERDVGQATTLDVLNAQAQVTTAREALISANSTKVIAAFSLIASEGRLSPRDLALNVQVKTGAAYIEKVQDTWGELRTLK
jgi:outer membrane protein